jgi:oxygen-dependent protoporphyrinogen oxidase
VRRAAVVGGGVAGLVAARELARAGREVVLVERSPRLGGALRSGRLAGVDVDVGAEAFALTRPQTRALVADLGLDDRVVMPRRSDARLVLPDAVVLLPPGLLGIPTDLSALPLEAAVGRAGVAEARRRDALPPTPVPPGTTLGALVRARLGDAVLERVVAPVVAGVHACHPDQVRADAVVPGLVDALASKGGLAAAASSLRRAAGVPGAAVAGLDGGMTVLVDALASGLQARGVQVVLGRPAQVVRRTGGGWRLRLADRQVEADEVVVATAAAAAAALLEGEPDVAGALGRVEAGDVAVVALVVDDPRLDADPLGSGALVAQPHPRVRAKALTHVSAKWAWVRERFGPGRHVLRLSYGLDGRLGLDPDRLGDAAVIDASTLLDVHPDRVVDLLVTRWPGTLVRPTPGHAEAVAAVRSAVAAVPGLGVVGAGLAGNGLAGTIAESLEGVRGLTLCSPDAPAGADA